MGGEARRGRRVTTDGAGAGKGAVGLFASKMRVAVLAAVIGVVLVAGVAAAVTFRCAAPAPSAAALSTPAASTPPAAHLASHRPSPAPAPPLQVMSASPGNVSTQGSGAAPVQVVFSAPLARSSPLPTFSPTVPGSWLAGSDAPMVFTPTTPFARGTAETLSIPGGASGVHSAKGGLLATPATFHFVTAGWSTLRLEQLLAQLHYLPLTWTPIASSTTGSTTSLSYSRQLTDVYAPPAGAFTWQPGYPSALTSQWAPGVSSRILTGALMAFQSVHGLAMDGVAGGSTWQAVLDAATKGQPGDADHLPRRQGGHARAGQHRDRRRPHRGRHLPGVPALPQPDHEGNQPGRDQVRRPCPVRCVLQRR